MIFRNRISGGREEFRGLAMIMTAVAVAGLSGCAVTPKLIPPETALLEAKADMAVLAEMPEPVSGSIGLNEAIARAIKYNREQRLKVMESALAQRQLDVSRFDMLPALTANAGYHERDELLASASGTLVDDELVRTVPPSFSVSQDKQRDTADLSLTWNILDFGLSYVRANQQADRYLIARERERKVVHNIIQDVRAAYWQAVSAEHLLERVEPLLGRVEAALNDSRQIERLRLQSPLDALGYQRELLDVLRSLRALQRELVNAKTELGTLMGLRPGQAFTLAGIDTGLEAPELKVDLATMEQTALLHRPELMESRYQARISREEVRAALLGMLPGISLNAGTYYDSNDFLLHNGWNEFGAQVAWNLFNVFKGPAARSVAKAQEELAGERRLALSMAVLSQVHLANMRFHHARKEYSVAEEYLEVVRKITEHMRASEQAKREGELKLIREELNAVLAELRRDMAYAEVQNSFGRVFASMGLDALPDQVEDDSVAGLGRAVGERLAAWGYGWLGTTDEGQLSFQDTPPAAAANGKVD